MIHMGFNLGSKKMKARSGVKVLCLLFGFQLAWIALSYMCADFIGSLAEATAASIARSQGEYYNVATYFQEGIRSPVWGILTILSSALLAIGFTVEESEK